MKKILALIMSVLMILSVFAACAKTDETNNAEKTDALTKEEIFDKSMSASISIDNYSTNAKMVLNADLMGEDFELNAEMGMAASMKNRIMFIDFLMDVMGEEVAAQSYISYGENPGTYIQVFGEWMREPLPEEALSLYEDMTENQNEANQKLKKYMKVISAEETEYNGKKAYEIKVEYDMDIPAILEDFGMSLDDIYAEAGLGEDEIDMISSVFEGLGSVEMIQYADKESFLPLGAKCDMTALGQKLVDKVVGLIAKMQGMTMEEAKEAGFDININELTVSVDEYNYDIPEIALPAEALEAEVIGEEALGIIGGADGPTEIIVAE